MNDAELIVKTLKSFNISLKQLRALRNLNDRMQFLPKYQALADATGISLSQISRIIQVLTSSDTNLVEKMLNGAVQPTTAYKQMRANNLVKYSGQQTLARNEFRRLLKKLVRFMDVEDLKEDFEAFLQEALRDVSS